MYLKRIEIYGFKSFAQKSVLDFDYKKNSNITAVVGPNGSGKSNVADAIRWVTGEQSSKNLRSKKSEDVIFCGSSAKPRGSYAEVSIILADDSSVKFELNGKEYELSEIEVSRKLYRSGESEYLINNKKVRLTDIQQLLASLGFGQSSYTVIGQGMVDRLLFFTASERKVLFDEAAGVKQYEIKREQSLRKLESTDTNLIRLKDILIELEPRVANLRRLVKKAEGRKELDTEMKEVQLKYFGSLLYEYSQATLEAENKKTQLDNKITELNRKLEQIVSEINKKSQNPYKNERFHLEKEIAEISETKDKVRETVAYLKGQSESLRSEIERTKERKTTVIAEISKLETDSNNKQHDLEKIEKEIFEFSSKIEAESKKLEETRKLIVDLDTQLNITPENDNSSNLIKLEEEKAALSLRRDEISGQIYLINQEQTLAKTSAAENKIRKNKLEKQSEQLSYSKNEMLKILKVQEKELKETNTKINNKNSEIKSVTKTLELAEIELVKLSEQITDESLSEFTDEIASINKVQGSILEKINLAKTIHDISQIKVELNDFSVSLNKIFNRFNYIAKAASANERKSIESKLALIRTNSSVLADEMQNFQYSKIRLESDIASNKKRLVELEERISLLNDEILSIDNSYDTAKSSKDDLEKLNFELKKVDNALIELEQTIKKHSNIISERQNEILRQKNALQTEYNEQHQILHDLELSFSRKENDRDITKAELLKAKTKIISLKNELNEISKISDFGISDQERQLLAEQQNLSKLEEDIAKLRGGLTVVIDNEREFDKRGYALEREKRDFELEINSLKTDLANLEISTAKFSIRLEDVENEISSQAIIFPDNAKFEILDQIEKDVLRLKMENIRRKLDTTSGVDPETESEYHELENRATEMSKQIEDLTKAKDDLTKVVHELDERIKHQFSDVFKNIAAEFNRYFVMLFNGGNAKLSLGEDENGIFGIEINANPPGKRVQSLAALSGGERTLTSLALLFAILSVNPSPFVVLDEVDAALDESNTVRFIKIVEDLANKTQFIVISHNRDTMKSASSLYGVTMDQSHISKLLSVKLTEALSTAKS